MPDQTLTPQLARFRALVRVQLAEVWLMHRNEAWYKGERVHHFVPLEDPEVTARVAELILQKGDDFLREAEEMLNKAICAA